MSLLITASALMHIQQQFGEKAQCEVSVRPEEVVILLDDGIKRYSKSFSLKEFGLRKSGDILMEFERDAKRYFAGSE